MTQPQGEERAITGVAGLDKMLGGGVLKGDATLVAGSPGTGKTTLGLHFLAAGVEAGEPGVFVTFEYLPQQIYRDAEAKGIPLRRWEQEGRVRVLCTTPDVLLAETDEGETILQEVLRTLEAERLIMDSMTHFEFARRDSGDLRDQLAGLMNHLKLKGITTLVTHEIPQITGPSMTISDWGLEFLVDNVIMFRYVELDGQLEKAVNVLKFRGGAHDRAYRRLHLTDQGMRVDTEFEGVENISSGAATRTVAQRASRLL